MEKKSLQDFLKKWIGLRLIVSSSFCMIGDGVGVVTDVVWHLWMNGYRIGVGFVCA